MYKISLEGYSFHGLLKEGMMDIFHQLETLKYRYGLDAIGIWNGFLESTDADYVKKVRRALDERGISVPNIAFDGCHVCCDDPEEGESNYKRALANLEMSARLGAKSVRIDWGVRRDVLTEAEEELILARYREYCEIGRKNGFIVCVENHFGAARNPVLMKKVCDEMNDPMYKVLLHVGGWQTGFDNGDEIIAPYAAHTHIPMAIAESRMAEVLALLKSVNYPGYIGLEHHSAKNEYVMVEYHLAVIRRAMAEFGEG